MIIKNSNPHDLHGTISSTDKAPKDYLKLLEERFKASPKVVVNSLLTKLNSTRYDGSSGVREHITRMRHIANKLNEMKINITDTLLVHTVINSLPKLFETFKVSYYTRKEEWTPDELVAMCEEEENRQKRCKIESAHLVFQNKNVTKKKSVPWVQKGRNLKKKKKYLNSQPI